MMKKLRPLNITGVATFLLFAAVVIRTAWVGEDAFITLRTIDNFINGFGLTWNINQRVQAYTHPLWMFVLSAAYIFTREPYYTTIALSILISLSSIYLLLSSRKLDASSASSVVIILALSKAFTDYSTSGLENPLSHFLLMLFLVLYLDQAEKPDNRKLVLLALTASFAGLNRLDLLLIFFPPLAFAIWRSRKSRIILPILAFIVPLAAWEVFSLLYYGFPFPNTAYAKLNVSIPKKDMIEQGIIYFLNSLSADPITLVMISSGVILGLRKSHSLKILSLSTALYLTYVTWAGGDFMSGRFFTVPLLASVFIIGLTVSGKHELIRGLFVIAIVLGFMAPYPSILSTSTYGSQIEERIDQNGIADERAYYYQKVGLLNHERNAHLPYHRWKQEGININGEQAVVLRRTIGFFGYYAGPTVHIIDPLALSDPLLARLPCKDDWRVGHYEREIPEGYYESLLADENLIEDEEIAALYDRLSIIVSQPVFSPGRVTEILSYNLGLDKFQSP